MADKDRVQQCGCSATPLPPKSLRQMAIDIRIDFCPLHAAAPELLNALNNAAKLAHKNTKNHNDWISFRECKQASCTAAAEAIRKAESK